MLRHKFQILLFGGFATISIFDFETGWIKFTFLECRCILPSLLDLGYPYFKSPLIGYPIWDNWALIWWCLPVFKLILSKEYFFKFNKTLKLRIAFFVWLLGVFLT